MGIWDRATLYLLSSILHRLCSLSILWIPTAIRRGGKDYTGSAGERKSSFRQVYNGSGSVSAGARRK